MVNQSILILEYQQTPSSSELQGSFNIFNVEPSNIHALKIKFKCTYQDTRSSQHPGVPVDKLSPHDNTMENVINQQDLAKMNNVQFTM